MNIPKIVVEKNEINDIDILEKFLYHPHFPKNRDMILGVFPKLVEYIEEEKMKIKQ